MDSVECELCGQQAFLYCPSDSAILCCHCDGEVHTANFLVAPHVRHRLADADDSSSSATGKMKKNDSSSSSLTQLSRDQPPSNKRKRGEDGLTPGGVEGIFVNWSRGFGLRLCGDGKGVTWREQLRRVEEMSGTAGDEILAVESRLARALGPQDLKEGWAEC